MNNELSERLQRIETQIAHLEHQSEQLNEVVIEQGRIIKKLQAQQHRITESVEASELERVKATSPKPPHYQ